MQLINNFLLWIPTHGWVSLGDPSGADIHRFCADTGCSLEDLPGTMNKI